MQIKTVMRCLFPLIRLAKMRTLLIDSTKCGWGQGIEDLLVGLIVDL